MDEDEDDDVLQLPTGTAPKNPGRSALSLALAQTAAAALAAKSRDEAERKTGADARRPEHNYAHGLSGVGARAARDQSRVAPSRMRLLTPSPPPPPPSPPPPPPPPDRTSATDRFAFSDSSSSKRGSQAPPVASARRGATTATASTTRAPISLRTDAATHRRPSVAHAHVRPAVSRTPIKNETSTRVARPERACTPPLTRRRSPPVTRSATRSQRAEPPPPPLQGSLPPPPLREQRGESKRAVANDRHVRPRPNEYAAETRATGRATSKGASGEDDARSHHKKHKDDAKRSAGTDRESRDGSGGDGDGGDGDGGVSDVEEWHDGKASEDMRDVEDGGESGGGSQTRRRACAQNRADEAPEDDNDGGGGDGGSYSKEDDGGDDSEAGADTESERDVKEGEEDDEDAGFLPSRPATGWNLSSGDDVGPRYGAATIGKKFAFHSAAVAPPPPLSSSSSFSDAGFPGIASDSSKMVGMSTTPTTTVSSAAPTRANSLPPTLPPPPPNPVPTAGAKKNVAAAPLDVDAKRFAPTNAASNALAPRRNVDAASDVARTTASAVGVRGLAIREVLAIDRDGQGGDGDELRPIGDAKHVATVPLQNLVTPRIRPHPPASAPPSTSRSDSLDRAPPQQQQPPISSRNDGAGGEEKKSATASVGVAGQSATPAVAAPKQNATQRVVMAIALENAPTAAAVAAAAAVVVDPRTIEHANPPIATAHITARAPPFDTSDSKMVVTRRSLSSAKVATRFVASAADGTVVATSRPASVSATVSMPSRIPARLLSPPPPPAAAGSAIAPLVVPKVSLHTAPQSVCAEPTPTPTSSETRDQKPASLPGPTLLRTSLHTASIATPAKRPNPAPTQAHVDAKAAARVRLPPPPPAPLSAPSTMSSHVLSPPSPPVVASMVEALFSGDSEPMRRHFLKLTEPFSDRDHAGGPNSEINEQGVKLAILAALDKDGRVRAADIASELATENRATRRKGYVDLFFGTDTDEAVMELKIFSPRYVDDAPIGAPVAADVCDRKRGTGEAKKDAVAAAAASAAEMRSSASGGVKRALPWWQVIDEAGARAKRVRRLSPDELARLLVSPHPKDKRDYGADHGASGRSGSGRSGGRGTGAAAAAAADGEANPDGGGGGGRERTYVTLAAFVDEVDAVQTMRYVNDLRDHPSAYGPRLSPKKRLWAITCVWIAGNTYWKLTRIPPLV